MTRVGHNSNDGRWGLLHHQPMTDRVLVGEEKPRHRFVDDCATRRLAAILNGERSSGAHLDAHCLKVVGADVSDDESRQITQLEWRASFDDMGYRIAGVRPGKRKEACQAS